jgi:methionyl-tRNA formyltransferase
MELAANEIGLPVWQPETINAPNAVDELRGLDVDLLVVCDYGEILKSFVLRAARFGGINLHGSLLPKYRGAAPVQWAILCGDAETGNTVIQMTSGLDAGPIVGVERVAIDQDETAGQLESRLSELGALLVLRVVDEIQNGTAKVEPQERAAATKAPRLTKEDGLVDWSRPAAAIKNQVRALDPWPRAFTHWQRGSGEPLRLILHRVQATGAPAGGAPGTVVEAGPRLVVAAGKGAVEILELQPSGKRVMSAPEFLRGYQLPGGAVLN